MSILHRSIDIPLLETTNPRFERERKIIGATLFFCGNSAVGLIVYFASRTDNNDVVCLKWDVSAASAIAIYMGLIVMYFIWPFKSQALRGDVSDCLLYSGIATYALSIAATCMPCKHNKYLVYVVLGWCVICTCITTWGIAYCNWKLVRRMCLETKRGRFDTSQNQEIDPEAPISSNGSENNDS
jgi:hypothetical protein